MNIQMRDSSAARIVLTGRHLSAERLLFPLEADVFGQQGPGWRLFCLH